MKQLLKKVVLLGDFNVGKTSLISRFVDNAFSDTYLSTIGVKISKKSVQCDSASVQMLIWDIEGHTDIKPVSKSYLMGAAAAIVVVDVTRLQSAKNLAMHLSDFHACNPSAPIIIALNKCDLADEIEEDEMFENISGLLWVIRTSAKTGENVQQLFEAVARAVSV